MCPGYLYSENRDVLSTKLTAEARPCKDTGQDHHSHRYQHDTCQPVYQARDIHMADSAGNGSSRTDTGHNDGPDILLYNYTDH